MEEDSEIEYRGAAEQLADLAAKMISFLENAPDRSLGKRWRDEATSALSRFRAAQSAKRQRRLFG